MGDDAAGIAVRAPRSKVVPALRNVLERHGASMHVPEPGQDAYLHLREELGWTMIEIEGRFMPRVAVELSKILATRVLGFDVLDRYSYEQVSDLYMARPLLVVTKWQGTIEELFPRDVRTLLVEGFARTSRRYPPDIRKRHAAGDFEGAESELIAYFYESIAPIDVRSFAEQAFEDPAEAFCVGGDVEALSTSVVRGVSFFVLSGLPEEASSS